MSTAQAFKVLFATVMLLAPGFLLQAEEHPLTFIQSNGSLILKTHDKSCMLADDALAYEAYPSPDADKVAVETELMSNLQIVRLYVKEKDGCFRELTPALSITIWKTLAQKENFSIEELMHPAMRFIKWVDAHTLNIELRGELAHKSINESVNYKLTDR